MHKGFRLVVFVVVKYFSVNTFLSRNRSNNWLEKTKDGSHEEVKYLQKINYFDYYS